MTTFTPSHMRIARPVASLARSVDMYTRGLGLVEIGRFEDHQGFDGVMLGVPGLPYHFELTYCRAHPVPPAPTLEDLLVFYIGERNDWERACAAMVAAGFEEVRSFNPYWDKNGRTFEDSDRYRIVLERSTWKDT